ncbi:MAG: 50S ribosomal protein L3 [archaeon]|nr:50S ribosomal protein L3 [archaeon]
MAGGHKPRSGSIAYYPRVRAKNHMSRFRTRPLTSEAKPLEFFGYKAGMTQVFGKNSHDKSTTFGHDTMIPATVIECPPIKVLGARLYQKTTRGIKVLAEATIEKPSKHLRKRIVAFKKKGKKNTEEANYSVFADLEKHKGATVKLVLLAETQPSMTSIGKKKADVAEINLGGNVEGQFAYAKEKFGKEIRVFEVFEAGKFLDAKAVTRGKGFQGVVKRHNVKIQRPKAKHHRVVGAISPWHPATVMWTVPRPGGMGYHNRTEYNKRILFVGDTPEAINPSNGFHAYGVVKNDYLVIVGSVPGPSKRPIALRHPTRPGNQNQKKYSDLKLASTFEKEAAQSSTDELAQPRVQHAASPKKAAEKIAAKAKAKGAEAK